VLLVTLVVGFEVQLTNIGDMSYTGTLFFANQSNTQLPMFIYSTQSSHTWVTTKTCTTCATQYYDSQKSGQPYPSLDTKF